MPKKHIVKLTQEQHQQLLEIVNKGKATARMIRRAHTLLWLIRPSGLSSAISSYRIYASINW
ncbi:hypothetical protein I8752_08560 [Nostocaceae cyanobacterium CENA369]|uniref:Uncharacterized protein n=1 Tax=Dendronalium phyllosphericum CENA369 TaxID=1725256 RepID=A0A8J7I3Y3_9NOST|nr:hypothetical protein [Dendronalium phyllosphericum]MBH8573065.1 hypothetical protein [Dendronalium phyllosphericum CENA369]